MKTLYFNNYNLSSRCSVEGAGYRQFVYMWALQKGYRVFEYAAIHSYSETGNLHEGETEDTAENLWSKYCNR